MSSTQVTTDLSRVAEALRSHDRFLLVTHENPDGDALGSIVGLTHALEGLGKDIVMYLGGDTDPPEEYAFLELDGVRRELPSDARERVLVALDCANVQRMSAAAALIGEVPLSLDIDHHHDNTAFGEINLLVADASSTGEIVRDILRELDVDLTPAIAEALYVALVMDTGRFQYANTTPKAFRLAAELVEAGVDVHRVFQGIFESVEFAKLKLLARALERAEIFDGGRLVISYLVRTDFQELGVGEEYAEGIIDYLRAVDGTDMAAVIREPPEPPDAKRRVSMRASSDELDVSAIARQRGGGGHRQAAGFSSAESVEEIFAVHPRAFAIPCRHERLGRRGSSSWTSRPGRPRSPSSSGSATGRERGPATPGRSTRSRAGSCSCCSARLPVSRQYLVGLDKRYVTEIDLGRRRSPAIPRASRRRHAPPSPAELAERLASLRGEIVLPVPRASAVKIDGERAYRRFRRGEQVEMPSRARSSTRRRSAATKTGSQHSSCAVSSGTYVRAIADVLGGHCRTLRRTEVGPFRLSDADEERILAPADALPFLPAVTVSDDEAAAIRTGRRQLEEPVRALLEGELVAVNGTVMP